MRPVNVVGAGLGQRGDGDVRQCHRAGRGSGADEFYPCCGISGFGASVIAYRGLLVRPGWLASRARNLYSCTGLQLV